VASKSTSSSMYAVEVAGTEDATIYQDPLKANGSGTEFAAGTEANGNSRRALLRFDLAKNLPATAQISHVELVLQAMDPTLSGSQAFDLFHVTQPWSEGTSSSLKDAQPSTATVNDATWTQTGKGSNWTRSGSDFLPYVRATVNVNSAGEYVWSSAGLVGDVQAWVSGTSPNNGWVLIGREASANTLKLFASSEHPTAGMRPKLRVWYTSSISTREGSETETNGTETTGENETSSTTETEGTTSGSPTNGSTNSAFQGTVVVDPAAMTYESAVPSVPHVSGAFRAHLDSLLAVRLRGDKLIDVKSLWATVSGVSEDAYLVSWQHAGGTDTSDLWVVVEPVGFWPENGTVTVSAGAKTTLGQDVTPVAVEFQVDATITPGVDAYLSKGEVTIANAANVPAAESGIGDIYEIQPERVFEQPQVVRLPIPKNANVSRIQVLYFKANGNDAGWYAGANVDGWLDTAKTRVVKVRGQHYLEIHVHHAGFAQLGVL
jgi:hypothetical protein